MAPEAGVRCGTREAAEAAAVDWLQSLHRRRIHCKTALQYRTAATFVSDPPRPSLNGRQGGGSSIPVSLVVRSPLMRDTPTTP